MPTSSAVLIRPGRGNPLFLLSGGGADLHELDELVAALRTQRPLFGVPYWQTGKDGSEPASVEAMAAVANASIRAVQSDGRYALIGYSLGGLVAVETARLLIDDGKLVAPPILIDALPYKSCWPKLILLRSIFPRALRRLLRLVRGAARVPGAAPSPPASPEAALRCCAAYRSHRPRRYFGRIHLFSASEEPGRGPLALGIWKNLASGVSYHPIAAKHLEMMRANRAVATIAEKVDSLVDAPRNADDARSALVLTSLSWLKTARLAEAMIRTGFFVDAVAPKSHPLASVEGIGTVYRLPAVRGKRAIEAAIANARPDVLVPVDDFVTSLLHDLYVSTDDLGVRSVIERSLGSPQHYAERYCRVSINDLALRSGVATPRTVVLSGEATILGALAQTGLPAFVKIDGSWGGTGVRRVETLREAGESLRELRHSFGIARAVKRALLDGDVSSMGRLLERRKLVLSAQTEILGRLAIVSAVCRRGELLGISSAWVVAQQKGFGPATLIRFDDLPILRGPVRLIVQALSLSGLCGFDFIISDDGKQAHFIELNPRATPTCDLLFEGSDDLLSVYLESLGGRAHRRAVSVARSGIVAT